MAAKKDNPEAIKSLHAIVIEMNLTQRRGIKRHVAALQKVLGDATDLEELINPTSGLVTKDGRGAHWARLRERQKYHYTDEQNVEKELTHAEVLALTMCSEKQLQMALYKGKGSIMVSVKHPASYGKMAATITKL